MKRLISIGEIMQRLTPVNYDRLDQTTLLQVTYGGSEGNVAMALANFGHEVSFATKVPSNVLGKCVYRLLMSQGVNTEHVIFSGDVLGTYYVEKGYSVRSSSVVYNRKHSALANLSKDEFNIETLIAGKELLHVSGITLALGEDIRDFTIALVKAAFEAGLTISFDFNYRSKLWSIEEASIAIRQVLPYVHICFASLFDIEVLGGFGEHLDKECKSLEKKRFEVFKTYMDTTSCQYVFGTVRTQMSVHQNCLKAYCYTANGEVYETETHTVEIIDRLGAGDAFVAGVLHILDINKGNHVLATDFGLTCGLLKHTINGDVLLTSEEEVTELMNSNRCIEINR